MKYIITERQYRLLSEEEDNKVDNPIESLKKSTNLVYNFDALSNDWDLVLRLAKGRPFILEGNVDLSRRWKTIPDVETLGNLIGVDGDLDLYYNKVITDLGNLKIVTGNLNLFGCTKIRNLGKLEMVGQHLQIQYTKFRRIKDNDGLNGSQLTVGGDFNCGNSDVESLDGLKLVKGDLYLYKTPLSDKTFDEEEIRDIPNLTVEGDIFL